MAWPQGKTTVHRMLLKVFIGVWRCQVSFETMFWLIWVKNWAIQAQKVPWADSTPPRPVDWPKSPAWLGLKVVCFVFRVKNVYSGSSSNLCGTWGKLKPSYIHYIITSVFCHLHSVGPKQLCAFAHLRGTHKACTSL